MPAACVPRWSQSTTEILVPPGGGAAAVCYHLAMQTPRFKIGDPVRWNSEAGFVTGRIIAVHTRDTDDKGHLRHCTPDDPQYSIQSDKTTHIAMHKGTALHRIDD